ncbi:MAG: hypothetical protein KBT02_04945 [Treponema sp.]|nr:hypothetical protein [Candidatus Treponema caballi]
MKSIRRFIACTVSVLLLLAGLTSCGNLLLKDISEDAIVSSQFAQTATKGTGTISGTIAFDGAIPAQMLTPSSGARTAFPSTPLTTDNFTFFIKAEGPDVPTATNYFSGNDFSLSGLVPGVGYTLTVWIFKETNNTNSDDLLFSGSYAPVTLTEGNPSLTLENPIVVRPVDLPEGQTQTVTFDITSTSKSVSSFSIWIDGGEGDDYQYLNKSFTYAEGASSSTHNAELSLPTGAHALTFQFYQTVNDDQILVYSCKEVINVIKGFDTYTWVKNGNAKHLKNDNTGTSFVIDDACLTQFARNTIYVDTTSSSGEDKGTRYSPFKTISKAFAYAQASSSSETNIFIKDGSSEEITGSTELFGKKWNIQAYTNTPGDRQGNATLTFIDPQAIVFCLFDESELSATGITFKGTTGYQSGSDGGFVYIESGSGGTFTNCSFENGNSCDYGGAIANFGECTLNGCTFSNNQAETAGGAIFSTGTLTISGTTTIENNISDEDKYEFLSFYGNLTLAGTLNFKDSERFEFHKENDPYAASSVTLVEGLSVTGSGISKIPLYYDGDPSGSCFFASGSESKAATYFSVPADGSTTYIINDSGEIKKNGTVSLTKNGETTQYNTLNEAFDNISTTSTITLEAGSTYEITSGNISISEADVTITVSGSGTATIKVNDTCTSYVPFELWDNATLTAQNIIFTSSSYVATYAGYFQLLRDTSKATFTNCNFENGKCIYEEGYYSAGAFYCQQGELILDGCTFTNNNNNWNTTAQSGDANDIYLNDGIITLKNQNTFSGPIIIQMGYYHYVGDYSKALSSYIVLDESISLSEGKTTYADFVFATVSDAGMDNPLVIAGLTESTQSWFPCTMPSGEDYFIDSDGKLQQYSEATTLYVGSNGSDELSGYGYSASKPFATLQYALGLCDTAKTIWVAKDGSEVVSNGDWSVYGKNADIKVTDDGTYTLTFSGSSTHMLISDSSEISLTGIEFTRSDTLNGGGSFIYSTGSSSVTCTSCSFTTNSKASTGEGGAIFNDANLSLNNCSFNNCSSEKTGGAIYNGSNGTLTLSDCTFSGNTASSVSNDIYHTGSSVTLKAGNIFGGGIKLESGKMLTITEALDVGDGTIKITPPSYTVGTQILDGDYMSYALSHNLIVLDNTLYEIDSNGTLQVKSTEPVVSITDYASEADPLSSLYSNYKGNTQKLIITIPENGTLASQGYTLSTIPTVTIQPADNHSATITFAGGAKTFYIGNNGMTNFNFNNITFERTDDSSGLFVSSYSGLTVTYKGCTFKDGKSDEGVIYVNADSEHIFENCNFTNNSPRAITIAAFGKLTLKGANSFGENDTIEILRNYQYKISLEAESVVKSGSTVKIYTESFPAIEGKQIFEGTYVSQAATFECTDPDYCFDSDGYCRKR